MTSVPYASHTGTDPSARIAMSIAAIAALTIAGAWFFQLVLGIVPCPLCLEQRYAYYIAIPLALVVTLVATRNAPKAIVVTGFVLLLITVLANAALGTYHAGVEWAFWPGPTDCSGNGFDPGHAGSLLQKLDTVKVIRCDEVQWRFLGISLAGYNVLISLLMAVLAGWGIATAARKS